MTYWVLIKDTEKLVAMNYDKQYAEWIAEHFFVECIVRATEPNKGFQGSICSE